jgi:maleylacetate reductase
VTGGAGAWASFTYEPLPTRVVFGAGTLARVPEEVDRLGLGAVLVVSSPGHAGTARDLARTLGRRSAGVFDGARVHVPAPVADAAVQAADAAGADGCVAVGGGSAIGLGKAVALRRGLPLVAVPTTYAGSEMTPVWGITEDGLKRTGRDVRVLPRSVVYDVDLTLSMPADLTVTSLFNALAHAAESLYAPDVTPVVALLAQAAVRTVADALPSVLADGGDVAARGDLLRAAWWCGTALGATTMSLHHKLCHTLGGTLDLPHAPTHTVLLPHTLAHNLPAAPQAAHALAEALGSDDPARALWDLAGRCGAPRSLADLGVARSDLPRLAELASTSPYANPRPVTREGVLRLLEDAWAGRAPAAGEVAG